MSEMLKGAPWTLLLSLHTGLTILSREQILCSGSTPHVCSNQVPRISGIRGPRRTPARPPPPHRPPAPWAVAFPIRCWTEACARRPSAAQREVGAPETQRAERESRPPPPHHHHYHRGPSGSHYGIVSRCHPAVVRNNGRGFVVPPLRQLQLDVVKCSARVVLSPSTVMWVVLQTTRLPTHAC